MNMNFSGKKESRPNIFPNQITHEFLPPCPPSDVIHPFIKEIAA
jgi:hypothetical protein